MDYRRLNSFFNRIHRTQNIDELKDEFRNIILKGCGFSGIFIYEVIKSRNGASSYTIAVDTFHPEKGPLNIEESSRLKLCMETQKPVKVNARSGKSGRILFPVVESRTTTYIISIESKNKRACGAMAGRLLSAFNNQIILVNSKDRDYLTGLLNRRSLNRILSQVVLGKGKSGNYRCYSALAIFDIDHFKEVNDVHGHTIGDEVLIILSQILRHVLRHEDLLFRYGGEEFIILLNNASLEQAGVVFERLRAAIETNRFPRVGTVTISIGYASMIGDMQDRILDKADRALYYAKANGRNRVCNYEALASESLIRGIEEKQSVMYIWD